MNTPAPCNSCGFLYSDCMSEDDPCYSAECIKGLEMGNSQCYLYKHYSKVTIDEKWRTNEPRH